MFYLFICYILYILLCDYVIIILCDYVTFAANKHSVSVCLHCNITNIFEISQLFFKEITNIFEFFLMNNDIVSRIKQLMSYYSMSSLALSKKLGYKSSEKISRLFREGGAKPSYDIIYDISIMFEINTDWLITGRGSMLVTNDVRSNNQSIKGNSNNMTGGNGTIAIDDKNSQDSSTIIAEYNERIKKQEQYIQNLLEEQKSLHQQIGKLIDKLQ